MNLILNNYLPLTFFVGYLGAVKFRCDYSYSQVGWLKYHKIPATWNDARLRCHYEGGMLASPTSTEIKDAMMNAITDVDIFTGIHATFSPGSYYSIDGVPLDAISYRWADNEPDNKNNSERCISINSEGDFSDVRCDEPRPYICYRANSLVDANACGTTDPEYRFENRTRKCYKFHTTARTFERAHFVCSAEGGHLAIINSDVESKIIRDLFMSYPKEKIMGNLHTKDVAFIGFNNWGESADWTTISGQSLKEAGFSTFSPGEPNSAPESEFCGSVTRTGYLNDLWCDRHFAFICEKQADYPAVCDNDDFIAANTIRP